MKAKEEIYKVKFGDIIENGNTTYFLCILGSEGILYHESVIPESIILKGTNILVEFTNKTKMMLRYNDSVQLFYREIEETEKHEKISINTKD
uniref:Uncharacterized protein n=1 Tax=viral metagenome TaxID=1070528 RepID=A0A6M3IMF6_9ZZZZ